MESKRDEFKRVMSQWLPTLNRDKLQTELEYTFEYWGIRLVGIRPFGETVTIEGEWPDEGVNFRININPGGNPFRTLFRWKVDTNKNNNNDRNSI
jgi:hypothetical protein